LPTHLHLQAQLDEAEERLCQQPPAHPSSLIEHQAQAVAALTTSLPDVALTSISTATVPERAEAMVRAAAAVRAQTRTLREDSAQTSDDLLRLQSVLVGLGRSDVTRDKDTKLLVASSRNIGLQPRSTSLCATESSLLASALSNHPQSDLKARATAYRSRPLTPDLRSSSSSPAATLRQVRESVSPVQATGAAGASASAPHFPVVPSETSRPARPAGGLAGESTAALVQRLSALRASSEHHS